MAVPVLEHCKAIYRRTLRRPPGPDPQTAQIVFIGPLFVGILAAAALILPPQAREVYVAMSAEGGLRIALFGIVGVVWLALAIYAWNARMAEARMDDRFDELSSIVVDAWLMRVRDLKSVIAAALPLVGLVFGCIYAIPPLRNAQAQMTWVAFDFAAYLVDVNKGLILTSGVIVVIAAAALALLLYVQRHLRVVTWIHRLTYGVALFVYAAPLALSAPSIVAFAQATGVLFVLSLVLITLIPTIEVLGLFIRHVVFQSLVIVFILLARVFGVVAVGIGMLVVTTYCVLASLMDLQEPPKRTPHSPVARLDERPPLGNSIEEQFDLWLAARGVTEERSRRGAAPYPVFLIAAQGGGIYAAASSMRFMAGLQDRCATFQQHVFTISAVSGGALGSAIFRGLSADEPAVLPCGDDRKSLQWAVRKVATTDHLSGLLLSTPIDWLSKLPALLARPFGLQLRSETNKRDDALKQSFTAAYVAQSRNGDPSGLTQRVDDYWNPGSPTPSVLMAVTSVETAHRIGYSPFSLTWVGDGSLQSMGDLVRMLRFDSANIDKIKRQSIIDAAISSARFPFVLPAWSIRHTGRQGREDDQGSRRLNFVDGGYADSSGATTVADILARLSEHIEARAKKEPWLANAVELHAIVLTDNETTKQLSDVKGTPFPDTMAPLHALFSARQLAEGNALNGARAELVRRRIKIHQIELDHRVFELPLGWFLSNTTHEILQQMIGTPEGCYTKNTEFAHGESRPRAGNDLQELALANSCVQRDIIQVIQRALAPDVRP